VLHFFQLTEHLVWISSATLKIGNASSLSYQTFRINKSSVLPFVFVGIWISCESAQCMWSLIFLRLIVLCRINSWDSNEVCCTFPMFFCAARSQLNSIHYLFVPLPSIDHISTCLSRCINIQVISLTFSTLLFWSFGHQYQLPGTLLWQDSCGKIHV